MARFEYYESAAEEQASLARLADLRWREVGNRMMLAAYRLSRLVGKAGFKLDQPRVPAGNPGGGEWTGSGSSSTSGNGVTAVDKTGGKERPRLIPAAFPVGGSRSGVPVKLPNGLQVPDPKSPTGYMTSPVAELTPVAEAGRNVGETYNRMLRNPETASSAFNYLVGGVWGSIGQGGRFDYQRDGNSITGYTQLRQFRNVSNFNVGLFSQQAGLTLDETLSFAGLYASIFSSNTKPGQPYGLDTPTYQFIVVGYKVGQSGQYGAAASLKSRK